MQIIMIDFTPHNNYQIDRKGKHAYNAHLISGILHNMVAAYPLQIIICIQPISHTVQFTHEHQILIIIQTNAHTIQTLYWNFWI